MKLEIMKTINTNSTDLVQCLQLQDEFAHQQLTDKIRTLWVELSARLIDFEEVSNSNIACAEILLGIGWTMAVCDSDYDKALFLATKLIEHPQFKSFDTEWHNITELRKAYALLQLNYEQEAITIYRQNLDKKIRRRPSVCQQYTRNHLLEFYRQSADTQKNPSDELVSFTFDVCNCYIDFSKKNIERKILYSFSELKEQLVLSYPQDLRLQVELNNLFAL